MKEDKLTRREALGLLGAAAAAPLLGCLSEPSSGGAAASVSMPPCVVRPEQTEGPYFLDVNLNRSDIRVDPADGTVKEGVPLDLVFRISEVGDDACTPLSGAVVDVWQCDAHGVYSGFEDMNGYFDTRDQKFLRGYQVTDEGGVARFTTIYPGWYRGRAVHIHFKVRTDPDVERGYEFTSQVYFDEAVTEEVLQQAAYTADGENRVRNEQDGIFRRGGDQLMLQLTQEGAGYVGTFDLGLQFA